MKTNESKFFPIPKKIYEKNGLPNINSTFCDRQGRIWIGSLSGVHVIDEKNGTYTVYDHHPEDPNSISDNSINQIYQDSNDDVWVATFNGLNKVVDYTPENFKFISFKHDNQQTNSSIPANRILSLVEINKILYVGSDNGISGYDLNQNTFTDYSKSNYKKNILTLEKTHNGKIWASTIDGFLFFDPETKAFEQYNKQDGLGESNFQMNASAQDQKGYLYFGSRQGITRFHPVNINQNEKPPAVILTDIHKMSPSSHTNLDGYNTTELILNHNDYYLSIDYVAINYNQPEKNQYAYKLEGFDDQWNYPESKQSAVYTNLAPGNYTFRVKAANNDGYWNETGATLKITKHPAFWQTWWFRFLVAMVLFGFTYLGIKQYTKSIKEKNNCLLYTSPSPRDLSTSRMPSSA